MVIVELKRYTLHIFVNLYLFAFQFQKISQSTCTHSSNTKSMFFIIPAKNPCHPKYYYKFSLQICH